ncbi:MAG: hypothetical protein IKG25_11655 [Mogibacterium sp.]|nr:hypothetical protein [Mogibacterium sp.]
MGDQIVMSILVVCNDQLKPDIARLTVLCGALEAISERPVANMLLAAVIRDSGKKKMQANEK